MQIILKILLASIVLIVGQTQKDCFEVNSDVSVGPLQLSLIDQIPDLESGSVTIVKKTTDRYSCFNVTYFQLGGDKNFSGVASIANIDNYLDNDGLDFTVSLVAKQTLAEGILILSKTATWTAAKIYYIVTAKPDFVVGTFVPESTVFLPCGKSSNLIRVDHKLVKPWTANKLEVRAMAFLSGIRTLDTSILIKFQNTVVDSEKMLLSVPLNFTEVNFPIQYFQIGFIIVTLASKFYITNLINLNNVPNAFNVFVGMTGVQTLPQNNSSQILKASINTVNQNKFREFFKIQGVVIQSSEGFDFLFSTGQSVGNKNIKCASPKKCSELNGSMKYSQSEEFLLKSECILCEKYAFFNKQTQKCECLSQYLMVNSTCVEKKNLCPENTKVYNQATQKCECATEYQSINNDCVVSKIRCKNGFTNVQGKCFRLTKIKNLPQQIEGL